MYLHFICQRKQWDYITKSFNDFICSLAKDFVTLSVQKTTLIIYKMKRKDLKKRINYLCGELLAECIAMAQYHKKDNLRDVENVMLSIIRMQNDWICRLSHIEPRNTRLFFKKLREDMQKRTDEVIEQIQNL